MTERFVITFCFGLALGASHAQAQAAMEFSLEETTAAAPRELASKPASFGELQKTIAQGLGPRHWGMSKAAVMSALKAEIRAEFEQRIKVERDIMRQDALYQAADERTRRLQDNYVEFSGTKSGWDVSPVATEFAHGNGESMLVVRTETSRDLYFFMHGKLWKWYRELGAGTGNDDNLDPLYKGLLARFGAGKPQRDRLDDDKAAYPGVFWSDGTTRVTALRRGRDTCLIYEDAHVADQLAFLRKNARPAGDAHRSQTIEWVMRKESEGDGH
jgi:hypothetical protein